MGIAALGRSLTSIYRLGKRGLRILPDMIVGEGKCSSESIAKVMKKTKGSIFAKMEAGFESVEKHVSSQKKGFWTRSWESIRSIPKNLKKSAIQGYNKAGKANKNKLWGGTKGVFKFLGNKAPLFMTGLMLYSEASNTYEAMKDKGFVAGLWELFKAPFRFAGGVTGAAIGTFAIPIPFVGTISGWLLGERAVNGIFGKSYTEEKFENEMKENEILAKYNLKKKEDGTLDYASSDSQITSAENSGTSQSSSSSSNPLYDYYYGSQSNSNNPLLAANNLNFTGLGGMNLGCGNMLGAGAYQDDIMAQSLNFNV